MAKRTYGDSASRFKRPVDKMSYAEKYAPFFERLKTKKFKLSVKQHMLVLDLLTAIEEITKKEDVSRDCKSWPQLTFFSAVRMADALNLDIEVRLKPRKKISTPKRKT